MPSEQNQQGRRPYYHRGRRGPDRRGPDRRNVPAPETAGRENVDVEQIMREIRARIAQRHGIELTSQQIQELAARRLEAILDPRTVKPSLLEQLRKSASTPLDTVPAEATPSYVFEDRTIYESHNGFLRFIRRLLNPLLKLFFNPNPIAHALNTQTRLNAEAAARDAERDRRQAEWNALHYEILQRLVTETARVSIEIQSLAMRVESLGARVDFNDRRVRTIEAQPQAQPGSRPPRPQESRPAPPAPPPVPADEGTTESRPAEAAPVGEGSRRRRRRRRGRRGGGAAETAAGGEALAALQSGDPGDGTEPDDEDALDLDGPADEQEPQTVSPAVSAPLRADEPRVPTPDATPNAAGGSDTETVAAAPAPFPHDAEGSATSPPSPPRDEPADAEAEPPDPGPVDR